MDNNSQKSMLQQLNELLGRKSLQNRDQQQVQKLQDDVENKGAQLQAVFQEFQDKNEELDKAFQQKLWEFFQQNCQNLSTDVQVLGELVCQREKVGEETQQVLNILSNLRQNLSATKQIWGSLSKY